MFCPKCGTRIEEGNAFCPECGNRFVQSGEAAANQAYTRAAQNGDNSDANTMNTLINYFSAKEAVYEEHDKLCGILDPRSFGKKVGLLIGGILAFFYGCAIGIGLIISSTGDSDLYLGLLAFIIGSVGIIMFISFFSRLSKRRKACSEAYSKLEATIQLLHQNYLNYGDCPVQEEYTNPSNLKEMLGTLQSGEAGSINDAITLLLYNAKMNNIKALERLTAISTLRNAKGADSSIFFYEANISGRQQNG